MSDTPRACRLARTELGVGARHDPPRRVGRPVERECPALGEGGRALLRPAHHGGRVTVLHVAAPAELQLDRHRRRDLLDAHGGDPDPLHARPSHDEPSPPARVARVQELTHRLGRSDPLKSGVVAVHRLGPGTHGPPRGRLEHVGREAGVGDGEVERPGASVAVEADLGQVSGREALRQRVGDCQLGERLVREPLPVRPRRRDYRLVELMVPLRPLLDRLDHPLAVPARERPVLHQRHELVLLPLAHDPAAARVEHVGTQARLDAYDGAVLGVVLTVGDADVQDVGVADHLHPVVPALSVEVVQAALPLHEEIGADELLKRRAVARVPCHLGGAEERDRMALKLVGREVGVVLGRLGRGGAHAPVALAQLAAVAGAVDREVEQEEPEEAEEDHRDDRVAAAGRATAAEAAPAAPAASAAPAEAAASGAGLSDDRGERGHRAASIEPGFAGVAGGRAIASCAPCSST
jgi:hypothetical protein